MPGYEVIGEEEFAEVKDVFKSGGILFKQGFENIRNNCFKVKQFETEFARKLNVDYALSVTSGTAALRVALASLNIGNGDEVITQSFTFVATVEAIIESKAKPVCCDIDSTLNLDPEELEKLITSKTRAVIVVHMLGTPAKIERIKEICDKNKIFLIEDTAWGCGGNVKNKNLGTWGDVGTFSFDFAKTITTGEGGMVVFKNKTHFLKASAWHDHGHENNPNFPRWEDTRSGSGFNFRMMELQGAVGLAQLRKLDEIVKKQRYNKEKIWQHLKNLPQILMREIPEGAYETADALVFFVDNKEIALKCRKELLNIGISTKILPEAFTWHFAGTWNHMPELIDEAKEDLALRFQKSEALLNRAVSIPISVKEVSIEYCRKIRECIEKVYRNK